VASATFFDCLGIKCRKEAFIPKVKGWRWYKRNHNLNISTITLKQYYKKEVFICAQLLVLKQRTSTLAET